MRGLPFRVTAAVGAALWLLSGQFSSDRIGAQALWPGDIPTTRDAQRRALTNVRSEVGWLQNATRTVSNLGNGVGMLWQQFQSLRQSYGALTMTLTDGQLVAGANELADLNAGLDIIQEAFANYHDDIANGRSPDAALNDLRQVLRQASVLWLQELNRNASRLRIGW